ncbi:MAG: S1C family serine protease, partial [Desulfatiglandales bacterium]
MSRIFASALLLSVLLLSVPLPDTLAEWSVSAISEQYAPSVVRITALDQAGRTVGSGSGFFLNTRGSVATNYHVLEKSSKALVENARGEEGEVMEITHADPSADLLIAETSFRNTLP